MAFTSQMTAPMFTSMGKNLMRAFAPMLPIGALAITGCTPKTHHFAPVSAEPAPSRPSWISDPGQGYHVSTSACREFPSKADASEPLYREALAASIRDLCPSSAAGDTTIVIDGVDAAAYKMFTDQYLESCDSREVKIPPTRIGYSMSACSRLGSEIRELSFRPRRGPGFGTDAQLRWKQDDYRVHCFPGPQSRKVQRESFRMTIRLPKDKTPCAKGE